MPLKSARLRKLYPAFVTPILIIMIVGIVLLQMLTSSNFTYAAPADALVPFAGTVTSMIASSHRVGSTDTSRSIALAIGLQADNPLGLKRYVEDVSRPGSVNYHRFLQPAQFSAVFAPSKDTYQALVEFLQSAGFVVTHTYSHRLLLSFSGTVGLVERVFHVTINNYTTNDGRYSFFANSNDPQVPAKFVGAMQSFSGMNNATRWSHSSLVSHIPGEPATALQPHSTSCPGHRSGYFTPDQVAAAYNLNGLYHAHYTGEGQTVALFELDTVPVSDLTNYTTCFGHSHTPIQIIATGTGRVPTDSGVQEVELDAELVLSAAPGLRQLKIYEAANNTADYNSEWAQIIQDAPPVVSSGWGDCEKAIGPQQAQQENLFFMVAAAQGESIFAASGDSGSAGCAFNAPPSNALNGGDPGSQPFVTSVGGTSLTLDGSGYGSETVWNNGSGASGGGISQYWTTPVWGNAPGVINSYSQGAPCNAPAGALCRETPDVTLNADPKSGYPIYCSSRAAGCAASGGWYSAGGSAAAAAMWAALMAITNEMALRTGGFAIGFANPLLYAIANNGSDYAASFHDVTGGSNDYNNLNNGSYAATAHYDLASGLGSYNAYALATKLVAYAANAPGLRSSPTSTTWYFAEGSVGGSFQEFLALQNPSRGQSASVSITYLFQHRSAVTVTHVVPACSRLTINVNVELNIKPTAPRASVSAIVRVINGPGIVAERPLYFNFKGIASGTDALGTTTPGTSYYFAEADARQAGRSYYTFISILNPSATQSATSTLTFYTGSCGNAGQAACPTQTVVTPPLHRGTGSPLFLALYKPMAISVSSNIPVVVERPMYFKDAISNIKGIVSGAASEMGATAPGSDWLFAEGYTGANFQEYFVLANFGSSDTTANIKLEYADGHTQTVSVTVPALNRVYFDVNRANARPTGTCDSSPCLVTPSAAAEITSAAPIVADRLMYFKAANAAYAGGTDTIGEPGPAVHSVYAFAEGYTGGTFQEFLTLQNPTGSDEAVAITFFAATFVMQQQVVVRAHSRLTFSVNDLVNPLVDTNPASPGISAHSVSATVQALGAGAKIVVERPMYFNLGGAAGGTDILGYTG